MAGYISRASTSALRVLLAEATYEATDYSGAN